MQWLKSDAGVASAIGIASLLLLAVTSEQGFVRDEGYYFRAAREYHTWFEKLWLNLLDGNPLKSFTSAALDRAFSYNPEHPGLVKLLMGWTWKIFHAWLGWTSHATGYRLASMALVALGNAFTYLLARRLFSRGVASLAVALLLACPHVFYHSHLACFDGPIMGLTVVVVYAFVRALKSSAWTWTFGIAWGAAIATKHNAVFLLPTLGLAWICASGARLRLDARRRLVFPDIPMAFLSAALLGPFVFYVFYPVGWVDPVQKIGDYYRFHLHHEHYPVAYFGNLLTAPPFPMLFPFVMSALTIPAPILIPGLAGVLRLLVATLPFGKRARSDFGGDVQHHPLERWLLLLCIAVPPAIIAVPSVPIFGGTKHWMTMMPFFCIVAAWVIVDAARALASLVSSAQASASDDPSRGRRRVAQFAAASLILLSLLLPVTQVMQSYPLGHTYFNELAQGHRGAAALGLPRTFWGGDGRELMEIVNERLPERASLFTDRMNRDDFMAYKRDGLLRDDIRWSSNVRHADWALINHQAEYRELEYEVWALRGDRHPEAIVERDGVVLCTLYRIPR